MVSPVDGRLVAYGYDVDNRVLAIRRRHGTIQLLLVVEAILF